MHCEVIVLHISLIPNAREICGGYAQVIYALADKTARKYEYTNIYTIFT